MGSGIAWLIVYRRSDGGKGVVRLRPKKDVSSTFLFPKMRRWVYEWLNGEVNLHDIDIY